MQFFCRPGVFFAVCLTLCLALAQPAAAIQNIGFPDDQSVSATAADAKRFNAARKSMLGALATLAKFDGVDGEAKKEVMAAMKTIGANAQILEGIAARAGNKDVVRFMSTLKSWSISGDADDRPTSLLKKIGTSLRGLKVTTK